MAEAIWAERSGKNVILYNPSAKPILCFSLQIPRMHFMNRRNFFTLTAGAILGTNLPSGEPQSPQRDAGLKFTQQRTGAGPFRLPGGGGRPHMLLISADMVSPDLYHPARPVSTHVRIPNIRPLMEDATSFSK